MFNNHAYELLQKEIPKHITIVGVTKQKSSEDIIDALHAGITIIGESYVQEAVLKYPLIKETLQKTNSEFHFIGRIQSNKIAKICEYFDCIQSVCTLEHATKIQTACEKLGKKITYFIQVNGDEKQKSGITHSQVFELYHTISHYTNMQFCGLMCIPPQGKEEMWFSNMHQLQKEFLNKKILCVLSMGMSNDYTIAITHGSTMIRIGSLLFNYRPSKKEGNI